MQPKNTSALNRIVLLAYTLTFVTGVAVILPFELKAPAAEFFQTTGTAMGYAFSFFMVGMLITTFLNGFIVKKINIKHEIFIIAAIYTLAALGISRATSVPVFTLLVFIMGLCFGLNVTIPNFLIVHSFDRGHRSSKLNRLDFYFSFGSLLYPLIAGFMLTHHLSWQQVYLSVIIVFAGITALASVVKLPDVNVCRDESSPRTFSKWNLNVCLVGMAIFFYLASYVGFTYWVVDYLTDVMHQELEPASFGLSLFWIFYAAGCYLSSIMVKRIAVHKYIIGSATVAFISYLLVLRSATVTMAWISISLLGLGCATIYSSSISLGTHQVKHPSPRIVSFFITCSAVGTMLAQVLSSFIKEHLGLGAVIVVSALLMLTCVALIVAVSLRQKHPTADH